MRKRCRALDISSPGNRSYACRRLRPMVILTVYESRDATRPKLAVKSTDYTRPIESFQNYTQGFLPNMLPVIIIPVNS